MKSTRENVKLYEKLGKAIQGANVKIGNDKEFIIKPLFLKKYPFYKEVDASAYSAQKALDFICSFHDTGIIMYNVKIPTEGKKNGYKNDHNQMDYIIIHSDRIDLIDIKSRGTNGDQTPQSYADKLLLYEVLIKEKLKSLGILKSISIFWLKDYSDKEAYKLKTLKLFKTLRSNGLDAFQLASYFNMSSEELEDFFAPYKEEIYRSKLLEQGINPDQFLQKGNE